MTTIPSRLSQVSTTSGSLAIAQARARSLYRDWYRAAPIIPVMYGLSVPPVVFRAKFRQWFTRYEGLTDLRTLDVLLLKSHQEYQETMNQWKQEAQLMLWFKDETSPARPETFMDEFYAGRDEGRLVYQ